MSDIKINNITDRSGSSGPIFAGISTVSTSAFMVMPSGPTEFRGGRGRAIVFVGATPSATTLIDAFNTATSGNAFDFGDASAARYNNGHGGCASATRGVIADGTLMEYVIFSSGGGSNDFGNHRVVTSAGLRRVGRGGRHDDGGQEGQPARDRRGLDAQAGEAVCGGAHTGALHVSHLLQVRRRLRSVEGEGEGDGSHTARLARLPRRGLQATAEPRPHRRLQHRQAVLQALPRSGAATVAGRRREGAATFADVADLRRVRGLKHGLVGAPHAN